ncbi:MAG: class I SAM-dependent methyltransferase [Ginsengibacter sp.]
MTLIKTYNLLNELIGRTDIYLLDQIMKGRYHPQQKILDAGCGGGRNMKWFLQNDFEIYGVDNSQAAIIHLKQMNDSLHPLRLQVADLEKLPFEENYFDHIISSAVLHFATDVAHFKQMLAEMLRVLSFNGSLFIRMASDIGIENKVKLISNGNYKIPDGSMRFLLTRSLLAEFMKEFDLRFLEPLKTTNVNDLRCMSTLLLQKNS